MRHETWNRIKVIKTKTKSGCQSLCSIWKPFNNKKGSILANLYFPRMPGPQYAWEVQFQYIVVWISAATATANGHKARRLRRFAAMLIEKCYRNQTAWFVKVEHQLRISKYRLSFGPSIVVLKYAHKTGLNQYCKFCCLLRH